MHFTFDSAVLAIGFPLQAFLCFVLFHRGLARSYPIFVIYLLISFIEDSISLLYDPYSAGYLRYYFVTSVLDYVLQLLIIFEIGKNVLRPSRRSIKFPIAPVATVATLLCIIIAVSFFLPKGAGSGSMMQIFLQAALVLAALKILLFAFLAGFAQMLGIGWKNHVLQLTTGLAFFASVSLLVQIATSHVSQQSPDYLPHLDELMHFQSGAYFATLIFWIWAFSRNEAPRKDFTPQMQEVLVTIAETARRTRLVVTRSTDRK